MRLLILLAGASAALTACGKNDQAGADQNSTQELTAEKIVANDVTAIDAVTADDANLAADMNYADLDDIGLNGTADNASEADKPRGSRKSAKSGDAPAAKSDSAPAATTDSD